MNPIDILLVIVIALSLLNGYRRGFIHGVIDLAGWLLSVIAGLRYYQPVAHWIGSNVDLWSEVWDQPIAFIIVAFITGVLVHVIGYWSLRRLPEEVHDSPLNQIFGLLPGFINGVITAAIISALMLAVPLSEGISQRTRDSALVNRLAVYAEQLEGELRPVFGEAIARTLNLLTIRPDSNERVDLPFTVATVLRYV